MNIHSHKFELDGPAGKMQCLLDLPEGAPRGLAIFVHGGYWMAFGRESWSHLAAGALALIPEIYYEWAALVVYRLRHF